jgi:hypothetical protein
VGKPLETHQPTNVGIIGCGAIISQYLANFRRLEGIRLVAVADLDPARASAVADSYDGVRALTVDELLAADDVELVLNLTIPAAHAEVALRAIAAGKSVYGEKPLAATTAEARQVLDADWTPLPVSAGYSDAGRGFGVADLVGTPAGQEPRAGGLLAFHALDVMESVLESAQSGAPVRINSTVERPAPVQLTAITEPVMPLTV